MLNCLEKGFVWQREACYPTDICSTVLLYGHIGLLPLVCMQRIFSQHIIKVTGL